jgi:hypothetical protein
MVKADDVLLVDVVGRAGLDPLGHDGLRAHSAATIRVP